MAGTLCLFIGFGKLVCGRSLIVVGGGASLVVTALVGAFEQITPAQKFCSAPRGVSVQPLLWHKCTLLSSLHQEACAELTLMRIHSKDRQNVAVMTSLLQGVVAWGWPNFNWIPLNSTELPKGGVC